jgi:Na+/H+ antiporter NhaD/arsenite permease-like protein
VTPLAPWQVTGAWIVFGVVYAALAAGQIPFFRLDRTGAAFVGAVAMVFLGILSSKEAFLSQDYATLGLLFSMMLIVAFLVRSGILARLQDRLLGMAATPEGLLWGVVLAVGAASALFINDVVCLVATPMVLAVAARRGLDPVPYCLAVAMASNIGSACTPVGNPQNIYIASASGIPYAEFALALAPVSAAGLAILGGWLQWAYRGRLAASSPPAAAPLEEEGPGELRPYVLVRTLLVLAAVFACFWGGLPMAPVAAAGAAVLLLSRRVDRRKLFALVDWDLLVLFVSLFIVTAAARRADIIPTLYAWMAPLRPELAASLGTITLVLSNVVSNVPAVFFLGQVVPQLPDPKTSWLLVALVSTLAGNLTLLGSIANLIVVEKTRGSARIGFGTYTRVGAPVTLLTLLFAALYWLVRF